MAHISKCLSCLFAAGALGLRIWAAVPLPGSPDWQSVSSLAAQNIALGDVNNDGFLDLAVAAFGNPAMVYKNVNGTLEGSPSWRSAGTLAGLSVVWLDIDRDGDMDLAVGHCVSSGTSGPIKLYRNYFQESGGLRLLDTLPVWTSSQSEFRFWLGYADLNGDYKVDLVATSMGNGLGGNNEVYYGTGATLPASPSWEDSMPGGYDHYNINGSLGDADGDGLLDLAVANSANGGAATAYVFRNRGAGLEYQPGWSTDDMNAGFAAVMAHIDGDRRIDLLTGGPDWKVHPDSAGTLRKGASQSIPSLTDWPWNGAFGDVDTNGFLDFCGANADQGALGVQVLTNSNGVLTQEWSQTYTSEVFTVAWGDINRDGVAEAVDTLTGNGTNRLYYLKHYPAQSVDSIKAFFTYPAYQMLIFDAQNGWLWWTAADPIPNGTKVYVYYRYSKRLDLAVGLMNGPLLVYHNTLPPVPVMEAEMPGCRGPGFSVGPGVSSGPVRIACCLPEPGRIELNVYNAAGRKVKGLADRPAGRGACAVTWDLNDAAGRRVPAGTYFITGSVAGAGCSAKIIVVK